MVEIRAECNKVLQENSISIIERLLPLRAIELTAAIEVLFKEDKKYHVDLKV